MPYNGSGLFTRVHDWTDDADASIDIEADRMDEEDDGFATGLSTAITKDGQTTITANLPMSGFKHTGVANGSARTDYASVGQTQDGKLNWIVSGGTADVITATYSPAITALVDGMELDFRATAANTTTTPTFSPNGITARTITKLGGAAVSAGDIPAALAECKLRYNLANTRWELLNPAVTAPFTDTTAIVKGSSDATKKLRFEVDGFTTATTRVATFPDADITVAPIASPTFTGTPAAPTAGGGTNTTQIATTAFVTSAVAAVVVPTAATSSEIKTGTVNNKYPAPDQLLAAIGFTARYNSGNQTVSSAGALSLAHGLGREPIILNLWLKCLSSEAGYTTDDKVLLQNVISTSGSDGFGVGVKADSTNITVRFGNQGQPLIITHATTGVGTVLTNSSWALVVDAFA